MKTSHFQQLLEQLHKLEPRCEDCGKIRGCARCKGEGQLARVTLNQEYEKIIIPVACDECRGWSRREGEVNLMLWPYAVSTVVSHEIYHVFKWLCSSCKWARINAATE